MISERFKFTHLAARNTFTHQTTHLRIYSLSYLVTGAVYHNVNIVLTWLFQKIFSYVRSNKRPSSVEKI